MQVALLTTFRASRKEPLAEMLDRVHGAFLASGLGEPAIRFAFADSPLPKSISIVDRVVKRFPELERFVSSSPRPGGAAVRQISNDGLSPAAGEAIGYETVRAIAAGVPRSFPFHNLAIQFSSPAFGETPTGPAGGTAPGIVAADSWWINGRSRSLTAIRIVEVESAAAKLPAPTEAVAAVFEACGKIASTAQVPLAAGAQPSPAAAMQPAAANPDAARAVGEIVRDYKARLAEIVDRAAPPHDLPPAVEAVKVTGLGATTGPKKPSLTAAFKPLGYDCKGESGVFTLRRRTAGNLTVEISLDVGTWSRSLTGFFKVYGLGFAALLPLPVSKRAIGGGQYPIGDGENWRRIVENLAALVAELDRDFVPAVERAAGPSPEWYTPRS
jgi:hypothetical protein